MEEYMEEKSNELLNKVTEYMNQLKLKKVLFGGYHKKTVDDSMRNLSALYEDVLEQKEQENRKNKNQFDQELSQAKEKIEYLEEQKEELHHQAKRSEEKYENEMVKISGMKEQLAESLIQTNQEKQKIIKDAHEQAEEILNSAHEQAATIMDERLVELNQLVETRCDELKELELSRKQGADSLEDIQSELSQLSFKLAHVKRMLNTQGPSAVQIFHEREDQGVS